MERKLILLAASLLLMLSTAAWSQDDGASLYKSKCAGCHGASGEGKPAVKAPALKGTALTTDQLAEQITKGVATSKAPHNKAISGVHEGQAKALAEFIKTLK